MKRNVRVVVASVENPETAQQTQKDFPHLTVLSDEPKTMIAALAVMHPGAGEHHEDIAAPTTFLIDGQGNVRWVFRPDHVITRLTPADLLAAVDQHLPKTP